MDNLTDPTDWPVSFAGKDSAECEAFIVAINRIAYKNGKHRDDQWIADFAYPCFTGRAMRWYEDLSENVQGSWKLMRRALLSKYPPDDVTIPYPAPAAPALTSAAPPVTIRRGRIRMVAPSGARYLSKRAGGDLTSTGDVDQALQVQLLPQGSGSDIVAMKLLNASDAQGKRLGLRWSGSTLPNLGTGSGAYARLRAVEDAGDLTSGMSNRSTGSDFWRLRSDDTLVAFCTELNGDVKTLASGTEAVTGLFVAVDITKHPNEKLTNFVFEDL